ncbi:hypothetical protein MCOR23_009140 [Pyricularia oryzae]|nr:hypothetical protein MCOR23_009140 [Pyricularia oryzae]
MMVISRQTKTGSTAPLSEPRLQSGAFSFTNSTPPGSWAAASIIISRQPLNFARALTNAPPVKSPKTAGTDSTDPRIGIPNNRPLGARHMGGTRQPKITLRLRNSSADRDEDTMAPPSSARTTRSRASPAANVAADAKSSGVQKKSFMERWLEPQVQSKASFQEAGLIRQGVLENMAPLGTLPKPAVTRAAAAEGKGQEQQQPPQPQQPTPTSGRRITIKFNKRPPSAPKTPKASSTESTDAVETASETEGAKERDNRRRNDGPDAEAEVNGVDSATDSKSMTPPPVSRQSLSFSSPTPNEESSHESTGMEVPLTRSKFSMRKSFTSPAKSSGGPSQSPHLHTGNSTIPSYPALDSSAGRSFVSKTPTSAATAAMPTESRMVATRAREVVNIAVKEALVHQDYLSAWTIRHLFDENAGNPRVMDMFDQVFRQTAAEDVLIEFVHMIGKKKREGHKTKQYSTMMPSEGQPSSNPPKPAPYRDLVKPDVLRIVKKAAERPSTAQDTEPQDESGQDADSHKDKKQKTGGREIKLKTPSGTRARVTAKGSPQRSGKMAKTPSKTPMSHKRSLSNDSISSLSSAPSDLDEEIGDVFEAAEEQVTISSPTAQVKRKGRNQGRHSTAKAATAKAEPELQKGEESLGTDETATTGSGSASADDFGGAATPAPAVAPTVAGRARAETARSSTKTRAVASQPITTGRRKSRRTGNASPTSTPTPQVSGQNPPPLSSNSTNNNNDNSNEAASGLTDSRMSVTKQTAPKDNSLSSATRKTTRQSTANSSNNSSNNNSNSSKASSPAPPPSQTKFASKIGALDEDDPKTKLRRDAKLRTDAFITITESFTRGLDDQRSDGPVQDQEAASVELPEPEIEREPEPELPEQEPLRADVDAEASAGLSTPTGALKLRRPRAAHSSLRSTRSARKRTHDDIEDEPSPSSAVFPSSVNPPATSSAVNSRASTPVPRPAKKAKTGLRVKTSPMKKKLGPSAGVPRVSGDRGSPVANGAPSSLDENDDFCSSCNGQGELLCCETCRRAFHFKCVDPPLQRLNLPDEWFCNVCIARHKPATVVHQTGAFRFLMTELNAKNSSAFRLPTDVRTYFVGVDEGPDGEYEEATPPAPKAAKKKTGYEEPPDFYRVRDQDGKAVVCHACDKPSDNKRTIIPCSICTLNWHLDCLDPPMPYPPVLRTWRCPAHIDDLLMRLPGTLAPAHKRRRIKGASAFRPAYSRGLRNNGYIEVDDGEYDDVPPRPDLIGADSRLPAQGVVQDFVDTVRRNARIEQQNNSHYTSASKDLQGTRGALEILADACPQPAVDEASADKTGLLIAALVSGADNELLHNVSRDSIVSIASGTGLATKDKSGLKAMLVELEKLTGNIRHVLAARASTPASPVAANDEPPSSMTTGESPPATVPQLTEGTEKSTPEAEEDNIVVTPITELEETNSPIKQSIGCDDVVMTDEPMVAASDDSELITPVKSVPALAATPRSGSPSKK